MLDYKTAKGIYHNDAEREAIYQIARNTAPHETLLNIGIEYGGSVVCLRCGNPKAPIVAIDLIGDAKMATDVENVEVYATDSAYIAETWDRKLGGIFIDGDHTTEGVLKDCKFIDWLQIGGIVAFHDCTGPAGEDVNKAVQMWYDEHKDGFKELEQVYSIRWFRRVK